MLSSKTETTCPAVPLKLSFAFWPGTGVATVTGVPSAVIVPVTSLASLSFSASVPVFAPGGSTASLYVPFCGSNGTLKKVADDEQSAPNRSRLLPSGLVIQTVQLVNVLLEIDKLTC